MSTIKTPPYKRFLTTALHRKFIKAAVVVLIISWGEAFLIGEQESFFWSWFPIGTAGFKTLLLYISALAVFSLRIEQLHFGARTAVSPSASLTQYLFRLDTIQTVGWYFFSAWFFTEVYIWSAAPSADLGWVAQGKPWERRLLNERPIYLRSVFSIFAILQSLLHLYYDYDRVPLSTDAPLPPEPAAKEPIGILPGIQAQLLAQVGQVKPLRPLFYYDSNDVFASVTRNIVLRSVCVSFLSPFIYTIFMRRRAWSWSLSFAKLVWDVPTTPLSFIPPHYPSLIYRSLTSGFFLLLLWEASNVLFTAYVAGSPMKRGEPLTAESNDPNGTLLTGLKTKKEVPKTIALWELYYISTHPTPRRTTLFTDIDRPTGPLWTQILTICLSEISAIHARITPPPTTQTVPAIIETLPRLTPPLNHGDILSTTPKPSTPSQKTTALISTLAKSIGQSPHPSTPHLSPTTSAHLRQLMTEKILPLANTTGIKSNKPSPKLITGASSQEVQASSGLIPRLQSNLIPILRQPFDQTPANRARATILGSPLSNLNQIIYSIRILAHLATASLTEDPFGKVAQDVPALVRSFVSTVRAIEGYLKSVGVEVGTDDGVRDVIEVVTCLKQGLRTLLEGFGEFAGELGLGGLEVGVAWGVAGGRERGGITTNGKTVGGKETEREKGKRRGKEKAPLQSNETVSASVNDRGQVKGRERDDTANADVMNVEGVDETLNRFERREMEQIGGR